MAEKVKKQKGLISPELIKLAEDEIAIKFMEHPELETEVKGKISNVIEHRGGRQVVETKDAIKYLRQNLGLELASLMCSIDQDDFSSFGRAATKRTPTAIQTRNIAAVYVITDILLSSVSRGQTIDWFTSYSDYLYGIPAIELHRRPDDVRTAALNRIMNGEEIAPAF